MSHEQTIPFDSPLRQLDDVQLHARGIRLEPRIRIKLTWRSGGRPAGRIPKQPAAILDYVTRETNPSKCALPGVAHRVSPMSGSTVEFTCYECDWERFRDTKIAGEDDAATILAARRMVRAELEGWVRREWSVCANAHADEYEGPGDAPRDPFADDSPEWPAGLAKRLQTHVRNAFLSVEGECQKLGLAGIKPFASAEVIAHLPPTPEAQELLGHPPGDVAYPTSATSRPSARRKND